MNILLAECFALLATTNAIENLGKFNSSRQKIKEETMLLKHLPPEEYNIIVKDPLKREVIDNLIILMAKDPEMRTPNDLIAECIELNNPSKKNRASWSLSLIADATTKFINRKIKKAK